MMERPEMCSTLIGKNPDDEASRASDESVGGKDGTFGIRLAADKSGNDFSNVNSVEVSLEEKIKESEVGGHDVVGLVKEEGNLGISSVSGNECVDKGDKCSDVGVNVSTAGMKKDAVADKSLEGLEDVPVKQLDTDGNVTNNFEAMEIHVAQLTDEEQLPLLKDAKVAVLGDDFLVNKQNDVHKDGNFSIGDIVWCMAKNKIWWPALICDPSDVPKQATKNMYSEKHLVRHFGSKTVVWCPSSHLKHFLESFKDMSSQGKSKSFLGAIEKAVEEVGRRVKLEMSCSCIAKEIRARLIGRNKEDFKPWYVSDDSVARHFDPSKFLERVKNLAVMSNVLDIVELVATRSNISAYYSYFGHSQMYLRHLRDTDVPNGDIIAEEGMFVSTENTEEGSDLGIEKDGQSLDLSMMEESSELGTEGTTEKGFESRERKKSKYLSFPFVDPIGTKSLRDPTYSSEASAKRSSSSGKRLQGKISRKLATSASGDLKDLKVPPAQLLNELRDTSRGYFYLYGNTILKSTFDFFCEFRHYAFSDGDSASNWYHENGIFEKEVLDATPLSEIKPAKKRKKSVTSNVEVLNSELPIDQLNTMNLKACCGTSVEENVKKSRKRKEVTVANHQTNKTNGVLDLNSNVCSLRPHENSSDKGKVTEADSQPKKTKSLLEANIERHFGDAPASLNANTAPIPSLPENINPENSELIKIPAHTGLLPSGTHINSDKPSEFSSPAKTSSGLPDLNGNGLDPNTSVTSPKQSLQANMIPSPATHPAARVEEPPPLSVIKSNLEMMRKMLEESGSNISPDMRAKLENDVQVLLKKITDMTGSSS